MPEKYDLDVLMEEVTDEMDFEAVFGVCAKAFGEQTADGIWTAANPGWDTEEGKVAGAARMADRWRATKSAGHVHFVKASVTMDQSSQRHIVGVAIWVNASLDPKHGDVPAPLDFSDLHPEDPKTAKFCAQILGSMQRYRRQVLQEKLESDQKSVMVLDLCAVHPICQGRGVASKLVQWGLDEAKRLGDLEAITEASIMGRSVYKRLGFQEIVEIEYALDEEFKDRSQPSNVFLRTKPG